MHQARISARLEYIQPPCFATRVYKFHPGGRLHGAVIELLPRRSLTCVPVQSMFPNLVTGPYYCSRACGISPGTTRARGLRNHAPLGNNFVPWWVVRRARACSCGNISFARAPFVLGVESSSRACPECQKRATESARKLAVSRPKGPPLSLRWIVSRRHTGFANEVMRVRMAHQ